MVELFKAKEMRKSWSQFSSPKFKRPLLREIVVVRILHPLLLPLALPRFRASKSGRVLPEGYNGEEFTSYEIS